VQQLDETTPATREPAVRIGVVVVALIVGLLIASLMLTPRPAQRMTEARCTATGGLWRADVVGHQSHCDRSG
jgi:hypothetical protein